MNDTGNRLIEQLAGDLRPVRVIRPRDGLLFGTLAVLVTTVAVMILYGPRAGLAGGDFSVFFPIANGILLVLGAAAAASTVAMANPRVGNRHEGPVWAAAMAAILPLTAGVLLIVHRYEWQDLLAPAIGWHCTARALGAGGLTVLALLAWLRRGAPVSPRKAGLHLGVASGALGSVAYGLSCPVDTLYHLAVWHFLPVVLFAVLGMALIPRLIRW